jgi:N-acetylglucosaminyl-diphospho-decaprenol L-rhamnosyltransferase
MKCICRKVGEGLASQPVINQPDLSIIIINWKSQAFVRQCLASIYATTDAEAYEIFVVDNASYDGCEQMLKSEFPQVIFIQSELNLGFAGANNLAFAVSSGRNVLFLNPDTEIQGMAIQKLVSNLESISDAGMVGAYLLNSDFSLQTTCVTSVPSIINQTLSSNYLRKVFPKWKMWGMRALFEASKEPARVEAISGACMLAKRVVIEDVGRFSTDYFMYAEDMDLCVKVAKSGWSVYFVPDAKVVHHAGGSSSLRKESNFSNVMLRESLLHFFIAHRGHLYGTLYRLSVTSISTIRIFLLLVTSPLSIPFWGYQPFSRALSKWCNILAWSIGLTRSIDQHLRSSLSHQSALVPKFEKLPEL